MFEDGRVYLEEKLVKKNITFYKAFSFLILHFAETKLRP